MITGLLTILGKSNLLGFTQQKGVCNISPLILELLLQ
jgi:hypothetical protein